MRVRGTVVAVLTDVRTGAREVHATRNIVTDAGDLYYAQRGAKETPTNFTDGSAVFDGIVELATDTGTPAKGDDRADVSGLVTGSQKAMDSGYPKTNDGDSDNPGAATDVVTYRVTYDENTGLDPAIASVIITNPSPGASEPLLCYALFAAPFSHHDNSSLKIFLNHQISGV